MESNDFFAAAKWLSDDFELYWPKSNELVRGKRHFAELNSAYPAEGIWRFVINTAVGEGKKVVTDVSVTDGTREDQAITFHTEDTSGTDTTRKAPTCQFHHFSSVL